jgi:hypothetical protein
MSFTHHRGRNYCMSVIHVVPPRFKLSPMQLFIYCCLYFLPQCPEFVLSHNVVIKLQVMQRVMNRVMDRVGVGTQFSNLYTAVDAPTRGSVGSL